MAMKEVSRNAKKFQCLSTDERTAAPEGSTLHIVDTGEEQIYFNGTWELDRRRIFALQQVE